MLARRFFYVSAALFLLVLSYQLGASRVEAQGPGNPIVAAGSMGGFIMVLHANGDSYYSGDAINWYRGTNIYGALPTAATPTTMGRLKDAYRR